MIRNGIVHSADRTRAGVAGPHPDGEEDDELVWVTWHWPHAARGAEWVFPDDLTTEPMPGTADYAHPYPL